MQADQMTCCFLQIAANKDQIEEQIARALEGLADRVADLKIVSDCQDTEIRRKKDLDKKLFMAHLAFIDLAVDMTEYHLWSAYRKSTVKGSLLCIC
jgi:hypothetical protein